MDLNQRQFVSIQLASEDDVRSQVIELDKLSRSSANVQINSFITFLQMIFQANLLVSALNTNMHYHWISETNGIDKFYNMQTSYVQLDNYREIIRTIKCSEKTHITPSGFYSETYDLYEFITGYWPEYPPFYEVNALAMVDGFFGSCTSFDAILASNLTCLYNVECLKRLSDYFPNLNMSNTHMPLKMTNSSLYDRLANLLIEEWSPTIDYSKYFSQCAPLNCKYTTTSQTDFIYTIVFLLSLYGGLTIILRLFASLILQISLKRMNIIHFSRMFRKWIVQLNLFESSEKQSVDDVKQQRRSTCVYIILLTGLLLIVYLNVHVCLFVCLVSIICLLVFVSVNTQGTTVAVLNPSLTTYYSLIALHNSTLKCPCSTITIPYKKFFTFSPTFHQICSSDFMNDSWISLLMASHSEQITDVCLRMAQFFRALSTICQRANQTINHAIERFAIQSLATVNMLQQADFNVQMNATVHRFIEPLLVDFGLLIDTISLFIQIDQPLPMSENTIKLISITDYDDSHSDFRKV